MNGSRPDRAKRLMETQVRPLMHNGELVHSGDPRWLEAMRQSESEHDERERPMTKIMTTPELIAAAEEADRTDRNRRLVTERLRDELDPQGRHVVAFSMPHNDVEIRVQVLMKMRDTMTPVEGWLDISFARFHSLQEVTMDGLALTAEAADDPHGSGLIRPWDHP